MERERKPVDYVLLEKRMESLLASQRYFVTNLANAAALLWETLPDINWAGFYLLQGETLLLGPFQGKPACTRIPVGKGVCVKAVQEERVLRVPDVHAFPGHIACDAASRSEIVLPVYGNGRLAGVLDIDSPWPDRFTEEDEKGLSQVARRIGEMTDF